MDHILPSGHPDSFVLTLLADDALAGVYGVVVGAGPQVLLLAALGEAATRGRALVARQLVLHVTRHCNVQICRKICGLGCVTRALVRA